MIWNIKNLIVWNFYCGTSEICGLTHTYVFMTKCSVNGSVD